MKPNIFQRGDYRAFIVVASASDIDRALFAFPIFEGEEVSGVFDFYRYLYFPDNAIVKMRSHVINDPRNLGFVFADVSVGLDKFFVSTITISNALWLPCVEKWEDQWVFDHIAATTGEAPINSPRVFKGGQEVQQKVSENYRHYLNVYIWTACTAALAWFVMSSTFNRDDK